MSTSQIDDSDHCEESSGKGRNLMDYIDYQTTQFENTTITTFTDLKSFCVTFLF